MRPVARLGVIISANGNIYECNAAGVLALYAPFVTGSANDLLAVVSAHPLADAATAALEASAEQLGFGRNRITWVTLASTDGQLGARELNSLVEGIDPLAIVATDDAAASLLAQAFDSPLQHDAANRARCRTVVAFSDFAALLADSDSKQRAWHLLKKLH